MFRCVSTVSLAGPVHAMLSPYSPSRAVRSLPTARRLRLGCMCAWCGNDGNVCCVAVCASLQHSFTIASRLDKSCVSTPALHLEVHPTVAPQHLAINKRFTLLYSSVRSAVQREA